MTSKGEPKPSKARRGPAGERAPAGGASNLSRIVEVDEVPEGGLQIAIRADAAERAAIAKSAGLIAVESLEAALEIAKQGEGKFKVVGPLRARIVQTCVVSLEPFESEIHAEVAADFAGHARKSLPRRSRSTRDAAREAEAVDDLAQSFAAQLDAPDPIVDGRIDLGALVEEFLVLYLDPYPRKPGVRFEGAEFSGAPDEAASPFAMLKKLKDGD
ncbi:YceD family protein [Methylocella sp.]|jgi:hypothetical protein|uniref:YceD family protein n=1 Tax=Methylocella sp. TaxID=1978226 RepID=UPI003C1559D9